MKIEITDSPQRETVYMKHIHMRAITREQVIPEIKSLLEICIHLMPPEHAKKREQLEEIFAELP